jgi:hypothetical protein
VEIQTNLNKSIHFNYNTNLINIVNLSCHEDTGFLVCYGLKIGKEELQFSKEDSASIFRSRDPRRV